VRRPIGLEQLLDLGLGKPGLGPALIYALTRVGAALYVDVHSRTA
jgi:hypothetical protein